MKKILPKEWMVLYFFILVFALLVAIAKWNVSQLDHKLIEYSSSVKKKSEDK